MAAAITHRSLLVRRSAARSLASNETVSRVFERELTGLPARPSLLDAGLGWLAQGAPADASAGLGLRGLGNTHRALLDGARDVYEPLRLWREGLATAWSAARLARELELDPRIAAAAGLLHRLGELRVLTALAIAEREAGARLDAPSRAGLCAEHGGQAATRLFAAWHIAPRAASAAVAWRNAPAHGRPPGDAAVVYVAHLLASRILSPEFPAPGLAHAVKSDFYIAAELLEAPPAAVQRLSALLALAG
ncbi:MAG: HDOD domain-containing protein [Gammaproteobacteria bacterium]|nr:HDOD domain-containing protein [Gammaproteobacteria bacterium]